MSLKTSVRALSEKKPVRVILFILSLLPAAAGTALAIYYILGPGEGYFHADCTDSLYWANASVESGSVFDETFRYAALLPFSGSAWMIPLIKIFGFGITAHNIAMVIFAVIFSAAVWFCVSSAGYGRWGASLTVFAVTMLLSSSDKLREIMWGHTIYYSVGLTVLLLGAGLAMRICESSDRLTGGGGTAGAHRRKNTVMLVMYALFLAALAAGTATDGMQVIVIGTLPLGAGIAAEWLLRGRDGLFARRNAGSLLAAAAVVFGTLVGAAVLSALKGDHISAGYADAYSGWSDISDWSNNARLFALRYFTLFGVAVKSGEPLFDKAALGSMIRIACGILILVIPLFMLAGYRSLQSRGARIVLISHFVLSAAVLFGFICGRLSGANWRLTPLLGSAAVTSCMGVLELATAGRRLKKEAAELPEEAGKAAGEAEDDASLADVKAEKRGAGRLCARLGALGMAVLLVASLISADEIAKMPADYGRDNYNHRLAAFLESKGLEYGYATFWYCQAITVLSESKVLCREVLADRGGGVRTDYYQSSRRWYDDDSHDRYFVLLSDAEFAQVAASASWPLMLKDLERVYVFEDDEYAGDENPWGVPTGSGPEGFKIFVFSRNILAG